jgi:hypothetical protein
VKIAISSIYWIQQPIFYIFSQGANYEVKEDEIGGACSTNAYRILVGKPEGNRPLGRPRYR